MSEFILALDEGTTSTRSCLVDRSGKISAIAQKEFGQIFPKPGWVEHNPEEIWASQQQTILELLSKKPKIAAIGITNQRETTIIWNRKTGQPIYNAIVWQDRRASESCNRLKAEGWEEKIKSKTGLPIDAYFSGTKLAWILDQVPGARSAAEKGELCFGTIDSWLIWKLTGGASHLIEISNASRTMLFNINKLDWDEEILELLKIPKSVLPKVVSSSGAVAEVTAVAELKGIPISGIAGDQQAALFGQTCFSPGLAKNTYGTGCFLLEHAGSKPVSSKHGLITTVAWKIGDKTEYALEGSVFVGGAVVQWLRDGLGIIKSSSEIEALALSVPDTGDVYFVPAFAGLGTPQWDQFARGTIVGITRGTTKAHIARAALEAIAFQVCDLVQALNSDLPAKLSELRVDGGAANNNFLMQLQADLLQVPIVRPTNTESTVLGAAYLAGLGVGFWKSTTELQRIWKTERRFMPQSSREAAELKIVRWRQAVERSRSWALTLP